MLTVSPSFRRDISGNSFTHWDSGICGSDAAALPWRFFTCAGNTFSCGSVPPCIITQYVSSCDQSCATVGKAAGKAVSLRFLLEFNETYVKPREAAACELLSTPHHQGPSYLLTTGASNVSHFVGRCESAKCGCGTDMRAPPLLLSCTFASSVSGAVVSLIIGTKPTDDVTESSEWLTYEQRIRAADLPIVSLDDVWDCKLSVQAKPGESASAEYLDSKGRPMWFVSHGFGNPFCTPGGLLTRSLFSSRPSKGTLKGRRRLRIYSCG